MLSVFVLGSDGFRERSEAVRGLGFPDPGNAPLEFTSPSLDLTPGAAMAEAEQRSYVDDGPRASKQMVNV